MSRLINGPRKGAHLDPEIIRQTVARLEEMLKKKKVFVELRIGSRHYLRQLARERFIGAKRRHPILQTARAHVFRLIRLIGGTHLEIDTPEDLKKLFIAALRCAKQFENVDHEADQKFKEHNKFNLMDKNGKGHRDLSRLAGNSRAFRNTRNHSHTLIRPHHTKRGTRRG